MEKFSTLARGLGDGHLVVLEEASFGIMLKKNTGSAQKF